MAADGGLRSELRRNWAVLDSAARDVESVTSYELARSRNGPLRIHISGNGERHLLVPGENSAEPVEGASLRLGHRRLVFDDTEGVFLDVECTEPNLFDVFDELVVLVVDAASHAADPVEATFAVIEGWRDLLRGSPVRPLPHLQELGLFAELHVLDEITSSSTFDAEWWRGPLREPKDVVLPSRAWVEVKGVGVGAVTARVNGLEQLADVDGLDGFLAVVTVDEDDEGMTVDDLGARLADRATDRDVFEERLRVGGWSSASPTGRRWRAVGLDVIDAAQCPRITPAAMVEPVPVGVSTVGYHLDLAVVRSVAMRNPRSTLRGVGGDS